MDTFVGTAIILGHCSMDILASVEVRCLGHLERPAYTLKYLSTFKNLLNMQ